MTYNNVQEELNGMLKNDPEFRSKFEQDEVFRSFIECLVAQANICDRVLRQFEKNPEMLQQVAEQIAEYCARAVKADFALRELADAN